MKIAKVIVFKTYEGSTGKRLEAVATIHDKATPELFFQSAGLADRVESYTISPVMPLPFALDYSYRLQKQMGIVPQK